MFISSCEAAEVAVSLTVSALGSSNVSEMSTLRSVRGGLTDGGSLPWWHESQLHGAEVQLPSASEWDDVPFQDLLHRCHGNRLGLLTKPDMGGRDVPRGGEVRHRGRTLQVSGIFWLWREFPFFPLLCSPATVFLDQQGGFIGSRYKKVVYRQFTNDRFTTEVQRSADMEHLGIMGREKEKQRNKVLNIVFMISTAGKVLEVVLLGTFFLLLTIFPFAQAPWFMPVRETRWRWSLKTWPPGLIPSMHTESRQRPLMFIKPSQVHTESLCSGGWAEKENSVLVYGLL